MGGSVARTAIRLAMVVVGVALAVDVVYFFTGSLEMFPTAEQQAKARTVTGAIAVLLVAVEVGLWALLRRTRGDRRPRDAA